MNKLLVICGPTATGKTSLGIHLAKQFNGEIVSADSRQVYHGMDIGTGKSLPADSKFKHTTSTKGLNIGFYLVNGIKIWGYDLVNPDQEFSLAHFQHFAQTIIPSIQSQNKLPIVTGGTGLYLKSLTHNVDTANIQPNADLRARLEALPVRKLQKKLKWLNPNKFKSMNHSDQMNPRRLLRAIEVATYIQSHPRTKISRTVYKSDTNQYHQLWLGLTGPLDMLDERVGDNINQRSQHLNLEIHSLLKQYPNFWSFQSASATGYHQWHQHLSNQISRNQAIKLWHTAETQYLRRQLTWFKKQTQINWFDISNPNYISQVEATFKPWYSRSYPQPTRVTII